MVPSLRNERMATSILFLKNSLRKDRNSNHFTTQLKKEKGGGKDRRAFEFEFLLFLLKYNKEKNMKISDYIGS